MTTNNNIILVSKPSNITSNDVTNIIKKELNIKKVGHTGTLDPLATGLMIVLTGSYTKLSNSIICEDKEYICTVQLGILTDTLDITGNIIEKKEYNFSKEELLKTLNSFKGEYLQTVPLYSAVKINGKKLYDYARSNKQVDLPKRKVSIKDINLIDFNDDEFTFKVLVSKGTYIRSLVKDICECLNTFGVVKKLNRIKQGDFSLEQAYTLEEIKNGNFKSLPIDKVLNDIKDYNITEEEYKYVKNGNIMNFKEDSAYLKLIYNNNLVSVYKKIDKGYKPLINMED